MQFKDNKSMQLKLKWTSEWYKKKLSYSQSVKDAYQVELLEKYFGAF